VGGGVIDVRARQSAWLRDHGGVAEALRRNRVGVRTATRVALADAGITRDQARWIVLPFRGYEAVRARWFRPLGISPDREDRTLTLLGLHLGHLGAADHIVGLRHLVATGAVDPGDYVVLASAGAGMSWTTAVLQLLDTSEDPREGEDMLPGSASDRLWSTGGESPTGELIAA
jgi:3-oxoacyl-[acyl-carrier-protein] synthase-3